MASSAPRDTQAGFGGKTSRRNGARLCVVIEDFNKRASAGIAATPKKAVASVGDRRCFWRTSIYFQNE